VTWIVNDVTPSSIEEVAEILSRHGTGTRWMPRGGGTLLGRGSLPKEPVTALDLSRCRAVIDHAFDDLTVTVEPGIPFADLERVLSEHGQWLPLSVDPDPQSTVGGWIGADRRTPLAGSWGSVRDYLLGIAWMDGGGHTQRAGGRVVKNVAGYDLMKVYTGSLGELGVIVEATFKVLPRPESWGAVTFAAPDSKSLSVALEEGPKLFPAGLWRYDTGEGETLALVFAGSRARVSAQITRALALFSNRGRTLDDEETLALVALLERETRPGPECIAWGGALPEWLARPGLGDVLESNHWSADLVRGHFWARWTGNETALSRARQALRSGEGQLHLDGPSPLENPWGWHGEGGALLAGLKDALDPEGRFVDGRWPVSR